MNNNINQTGDKNLYVENNYGDLHMQAKVKLFATAVVDDSFLLAEALPKIKPVIKRPEVEEISDWIKRESDINSKNPRIAIVTGSPGIGKTVVMNAIYKKNSVNNAYLTWGIKADQIASSEIFQGDNLQIYRPSGKTIVDEIKDISSEYERIIVVIDQLDALSLSLSSNRKILDGLVILIKKLSSLPTVRVVVSCRLYDLTYDPKLEDIRRNAKEWTIGSLPHDNIRSILRENNFQKELSPDVLSILSNPLLLYLFLKVKDNLIDVEKISMGSLYDKFWELHVNNDQAHTKLTEAIDRVTDKMAADQRIIVNEVHLADYHKEINHLCSSGLLVKNEKSGTVSFFHQTLFDYVLARRFLERGRSLDKDFLSGHQGLFMRPILKSILDYQRSHDPKSYMTGVRMVLRDKEPRCRYHIQHMVVTFLGYNHSPSMAEKNLVKKDLWNRRDLIIPFLRSINSVEWLEFLRDLIKEYGNFEALASDYREALIVACDNLIYENSTIAVEYLLDFFEKGDDKDRNLIVRILEYANRIPDVSSLIRIVNFFQDKYPQYYFPELIKRILKVNPGFVESSLRKYLEYRLVTSNLHHWDGLRLGHDIESIFEEFERLYPDRILPFLSEILKMITRSEERDISGYAIRFSSAIYMSEHRGNGVHAYDFINNLPYHIGNIATSLINKGDETAVKIALDLVNGSNDIEVFTGLSIFTRCLPQLKDEAFGALVNSQVINLNPSWVLYGAGKLIEALLPYITDNERQCLIRKILSIPDQKVSTVLKGMELSKRLEGKGIPLSFNGIERGKLLALFQEQELKKLNLEAYREYGRLSRKFRNLENGAPAVISSAVGFGAMPVTKTEKMSSESWISSMKKYNDNNTIHFDSPTLEGQAQNLEYLVSKDPDSYLDLARKAVADNDVSMRYCTAMLRGFSKSGKVEYARDLLEDMLKAVNDDLNSNFRGFSLHNVLFSLNEIFNLSKIPDYFFKFLCRAAGESDDSEDDTSLEYASGYATSFMTHVINTTRGSAVDNLVRHFGREDHSEMIFPILEKLAPEAAVSTRGAALIHLGLGMRIDKERTLRLFLSLNHDFNPLLMSLPLHNNNPLIYLVKDYFDELRDYFEHAIAEVMYIPSVVEILWYSLSFCNQQAARPFLEEILRKHEVAKVKLVEFINQYEDYGATGMEYLKLFMKEKTPSEELAKSLDSVFYHSENCNQVIPVLLECYSESPSNRQENRNFFKALAAFAPDEPEKALELLTRVVDENMEYDQWIWNNITDILLQSYNGIRDFEDESMAPTLERAMDLLDHMMRESISSGKISSFMRMLDN